MYIKLKAKKIDFIMKFEYILSLLSYIYVSFFLIFKTYL
jgi:hypothetical protein